MLSKFKLSNNGQTHRPPTVPTETQPPLAMSSFSFRLSLPSSSSLATPRTAKPKLTGYEYDFLKDNHNLSWPNWGEFIVWLAEEQAEKVIELRVTHVKRKPEAGWHEKHHFICARAGTGGESQYEKSTNRGRKVPTKRVGCTCRLVVRTYSDVPTILGNYNADHSHAIGHANVRFTNLSIETRTRIALKLRAGVSHDRIVCGIAFFPPIRCLILN